MSKFGLDDWKQRLVGFCAHGANVNKDQTAGGVEKLGVNNPKLIDIQVLQTKAKCSHKE